MHIRIVVASSRVPNVPNAYHARSIVESVEPGCLSSGWFRALHPTMMLQEPFQPIRNRKSFRKAAVTLMESHSFTEGSKPFSRLDKDVRHALGRTFHTLETNKFGRLNPMLML